MRRTTSGRPLVAAIAGVLALGLCVPAASADPENPTAEEVAQAAQDAQEAERTVAAVQTDLVLANQRLDQASIRAAQAGEAYSAARWELDQALERLAGAEQKAEASHAELAKYEQAYFELIATTYETAPGLTSLSAMTGEGGIEEVLENGNTLYNLNSSMGDVTAKYDAAKQVADLAAGQAEDAKDAAARLEEAASAAKATADAQAQAALSEASAVAERKEELIAELAELQDISVELATRRQANLEAAAQRRAAEAAAAERRRQEEADRSAREAADRQAREEQARRDREQREREEAQQRERDERDAARPDPEPEPNPEPAPKPAPKPDPTPPPASSGAQAAISFARSQIGDPYVWAAAGPNAWDCSGLTMMAWRQGGKSLPHYSVGQYKGTTPISASQLKPGDLVFWGSSSNPNSIYHVALYIGNGRIIHAPRTGRPVTEESMYYWIPPNFFSRP